jgi:hypothetical protein
VILSKVIPAEDLWRLIAGLHHHVECGHAGWSDAAIIIDPVWCRPIASAKNSRVLMVF